jgi:hypothetical protein
VKQATIFRISLVVFLFALIGCGFVGSTPILPYDPPGFFSGIWHGLLAPWTLIIRFFLDIKMYAVPNSGWFYDLGFLLGVSGSLPIGWLAAIIAILPHVSL